MVCTDSGVEGGWGRGSHSISLTSKAAEGHAYVTEPNRDSDTRAWVNVSHRQSSHAGAWRSWHCPSSLAVARWEPHTGASPGS